MKRVISILMAAVLLIMPMWAAAEEDAQAALAGLVARVKTELSIGDEYETFSSDAYHNGVAQYYSFYWSKDGGSASVSCDENGKIYSFYTYDDSAYASAGGYAPRLPEASPEAARTAANAFLATMLGEGEGFEETSMSISTEGETSTFRFAGALTRGGVPTETEINLTLRGAELRVTNFYRTDDYVRAPETTDATVSQADALATLLGLYEMELRYAASDDAGTMRPVYRLIPATDYAVDAVTGEAREHGWAYYDRQSAGGGAKGDESADAGLTQAEKDGLSKLEGVMSIADLDAAVRAMPELGVTDSFKQTYASYTTGMDGAVQLYLSYRGETDDAGNTPTKSATLNARTAALISFYGESMTTGETTLSVDDGYPVAEAFAKRYASDLTNTLYSGYNVSKSWYGGADTCDYTFVRLENGVRYDEDYLRVTVDLGAGAVTYFERVWTDGLVFEPAGETASATDALTAYFAEAGLELAYLNFTNDEGNSQSVLCYRREKSDFDLDAATLAPIARLDADAPIAYDDAEPDSLAQTLADYGVGFPGGSARESEICVLRDAISLLLTCEQWDATGTDAELLSRAYSAGILTRGEYDLSAPVTRAQFAKLLVSMSGYGRAASLPGIYLCGFADDQQIAEADYGYIAIARGMNIAVADSSGCFHPTREITRGETLEMLHAFLTRKI